MLKRLIQATVLFLFISVSAACGSTTAPTRLPITLVDPSDLPRSTLTDPFLIEGERNYNLMCAHCHGYDGEGQLPQTIQQTHDLGMNTVPPHNATGHTWQHPDQLLIRVIKEGVQNPLNQYPMAAYGGLIPDDTINAILAYIKLWWTDEQREHQRALTENWARIDRELGINPEDEEMSFP